jgi:hypothetical protein
MFLYQSSGRRKQDAIYQTIMLTRKYIIDTLIGTLGLIMLTWTTTSTVLVSVTLIQQPGHFYQSVRAANILCLLPLILVPPYGFFGFLIGSLALITRGFPQRDTMDIREPS